MHEAHSPAWGMALRWVPILASRRAELWAMWGQQNSSSSRAQLSDGQHNCLEGGKTNYPLILKLCLHEDPTLVVLGGKNTKPNYYLSIFLTGNVSG